MRNLILSAFPRHMRLPDPFTPQLKVDMLPEIAQPPRLLVDVSQTLTQSPASAAVLAKEPSASFKTELDQYLNSRAPATFLRELKDRLTADASSSSSSSSSSTSATRFNIPLVNSLVLYVGLQGIAKLQAAKVQASASNTASVVHQSTSGVMDLFQGLMRELPAEGRYLVLNAIANQLRYPNSHTHYFSCVLLYLFSDAAAVVQGSSDAALTAEILQEQITRVLLERLIVHRPHPWGLLITFIELIKNSRYDFWNHPFTRCAPEIERFAKFVFVS
jgi:CCR4-NOT transcription complex subunit 1